MIRAIGRTMVALAVIFCAYADATRRDDAQEASQPDMRTRAERLADADRALGIERDARMAAR